MKWFLLTIKSLLFYVTLSSKPVDESRLEYFFRQNARVVMVLIIVFILYTWCQALLK